MTVIESTFIRAVVLAAAALGCSPLAHAGLITVFNPSFEDPALRQVVSTGRAPERVAFATDLIGEALDADGGAS